MSPKSRINQLLNREITVSVSPFYIRLAISMMSMTNQNAANATQAHPINRQRLRSLVIA